MSSSRKVFQTRCLATAKHLSPNVLCVPGTAHDLSCSVRATKLIENPRFCMGSWSPNPLTKPLDVKWIVSAMRTCYHIIPDKNDLCCFGYVTWSLLHGVVNWYFLYFNVKPRYIHENSHCACAVSRDVYVWAETTINFETLNPICLFTMQISGGYDDVRAHFFSLSALFHYGIGCLRHGYKEKTYLSSRQGCELWTFHVRY